MFLIVPVDDSTSPMIEGFYSCVQDTYIRQDNIKITNMRPISYELLTPSWVFKCRKRIWFRDEHEGDGEENCETCKKFKLIWAKTPSIETEILIGDDQ